MSQEKTEYKMVFLTDGVVTLRPVLHADLPFLLVCVNDPSVRATVGSYLPHMEDDEEKWIKCLSENRNSDIVFVIEVKGEPIGIMGIHKINWKDRVAETGAMIKAMENRGKGYGTRAKMLVLHYLFHEVNLRKVCSGALVFNAASLRFNEKCGYKVEGVFRKHIFKAGEYHDLVRTAVFREDFEPLWKEHKSKYGIEM